MRLSRLITLQKREKIMVAASAAFLVVLALYWLWPSQQYSLADLRMKNSSLKKNVEETKSAALRGKKAAERLAQLQRRSLPADKETARLFYNDWLRELVHQAEFRNPKVNAMEGLSRKGVYELFIFDIQGQASLEKLTRFLYDFYSAGHLHKIRTMTITPVENSRELLDLKITVEAMSLPGSMQKNKLSAEPAKRLKLASLEDYKKVIVGRNLFAAYAPKASNNSAKKDSKSDPKLDPLQFSYLTAIIEADGVAEAWLFERSSGETFRVHEGEEFTIGKVHGKVNRIGYNEIEIEIDGQSHIVGYGNNLKM